MVQLVFQPGCLLSRAPTVEPGTSSTVGLKRLLKLVCRLRKDDFWANPQLQRKYHTIQTIKPQTSTRDQRLISLPMIPYDTPNWHIGTENDSRARSLFFDTRTTLFVSAPLSLSPQQAATIIYCTKLRRGRNHNAAASHYRLKVIFSTFLFAMCDICAGLAVG